jgi:hypothetical protein
MLPLLHMPNTKEKQDLLSLTKLYHGYKMVTKDFDQIIITDKLVKEIED